MDYSTIIGIVPAILNTTKTVIDIYNSNNKIKKRAKGTGFDSKIHLIEEKLKDLKHFKETLLFYSRLLPETASVYTLSDKLNEMIQGSLKDLNDTNSQNHDSTWQLISMMYNSLKEHKNNQIISRTDVCPYSPNSEEIKDINRLIRALENEFERANAYLISRNVTPFHDQTVRITQITSDLKTMILKHAENLINSIST